MRDWRGRGVFMLSGPDDNVCQAVLSLDGTSAMASTVSHGTQRTQRMVLRNSLLGADVAEQFQLLLVFSPHAFFLSVRTVETREFSDSTRVFPQPARTQTSPKSKLSLRFGKSTICNCHAPSHPSFFSPQGLPTGALAATTLPITR